jgi:hypothetical protein
MCRACLLEVSENPPNSEHKRLWDSLDNFQVDVRASCLIQGRQVEVVRRIGGEFDDSILFTNGLMVKGNMSKGDVNEYCQESRAPIHQESRRSLFSEVRLTTRSNLSWTVFVICMQFVKSADQFSKPETLPWTCVEISDESFISLYALAIYKLITRQ